MSTQVPPGRDIATRYYEDGLRKLAAGNRDQAWRLFVTAVQADENFAPAHYQIGNCLRMAARPVEAEQALRAAIACDATLFDAYVSLAFLLRETGRLESVGPLLQEYQGSNPSNVENISKAAALLVDFRLYRPAERLYAHLCTLAPTSANLQRLGECRQKTGDYAGAEAPLLAAVECDPPAAAACLLLANNRRMQEGDNALAERFEAVLRRNDIDDDTRTCLHFALGKIYDDLQRYEAAFAHADAGNAMYRRDHPFDRATWDAMLDALDAAAGTLAEPPVVSASAGETRPVFIVGMLRSGTTLAERILGRHPQVCALGELELVDRLAARTRQITGLDYPHSVRALNRAQVAQLRHEYRAQWPQEAHRASAAVDKNPLNFLHLALIRKVFPEAVVVNCRRDPRDVGLSLYFQHFAREMHAYASSFDDIAFVYRGYRRLMRRCEALLADWIYTLEYERLIAEPEVQTRALVAAACLPWDARCLEPERHDAAIATASVWQARQPIYSRSAGRWRHYESQLAPLIAALGDELQN